MKCEALDLNNTALGVVEGLSIEDLTVVVDRVELDLVGNTDVEFENEWTDVFRRSRTVYSKLQSPSLIRYDEPSH